MCLPVLAEEHRVPESSTSSLEELSWDEAEIDDEVLRLRWENFSTPRRKPSLLPILHQWHAQHLPRVPVRLPGEFESQEALLLGLGELSEFYPELLAEIVAHSFARVKILGLSSDNETRMRVEQVLKRHKLPRTAVQFLPISHDTMWARDYGPWVVQQPDGTPSLVDATYVEDDRPNDENVPLGMRYRLGMQLRQAPLTIEGGNLLSNGQGLLVATDILLERNSDRGYDESKIVEVMCHYFGAEDVLLLEPLVGEQTAHVDMFATFTSPNTVIVGEYDPVLDPVNAAILDRNAQRLSQLFTPNGPLKVFRVPMPSNADEHWRTYTNVIFANGTLLVPVYPNLNDPGKEQALATYRKLLPNWHVVEIDASSIIEMGGALHCISMNMAKMPSSRRLARNQRRPKIGLPAILAPLTKPIPLRNAG